jgi:hypothetical protein
MMMTAAKDSFMARATRTTAVVVLALTFLESRTVLADSLSEMISPVSLPTINEDPRVDTEIRPLFLYTDISNDFVTNGGNYSVVAIQARLAITERFGLIATKDGYIFLRPKNVVPDNDGFANLAFGIKGALLRDAASGSILSAGFRYEAPSGEQDVLQGRGDGLVNPFVSASATSRSRATPDRGWHSRAATLPSTISPCTPTTRSTGSIRWSSSTGSTC